MKEKDYRLLPFTIEVTGRDFLTTIYDVDDYRFEGDVRLLVTHSDGSFQNIEMLGRDFKIKRQR